MHARAIETRYKGYRFRSRLEARWAVFFDALGLKWEYEPEGFELPSGRYLPDFYLGDRARGGRFQYGPWVEIKATEPTSAEIKKMTELCDTTTCYGLVLWGQPGRHEWMHFHKEGHPDDCSDGDICTGTDLADYLNTCWREVRDAVEAARGARFEHGESGARK